jgi:DNA-binding transcriptional LysR family regulator
MPDHGELNLNRLAVFVAVVEAGSFTAAAARLGLAKTVVSTHIQRLEAEVGANLLVRSTRRLSVTDAGRAFYQACCAILQATREAVSAARVNSLEPHGTLRVATPIDYGTAVVAPMLVALRQRYPLLQIELVSGDSFIDLIAQNIDVAVRLGQLADSGYQAVTLGRFVKWVVASPEFVAQHGMPQAPAQLAALPFVALSALAQPNTFTLAHAQHGKQLVRTKSVLLADTATACRAATLAGGGAALLTDFATRDDLAAGRLVRLLPQWATPSAGIHAIFPATRHRARKVGVFVEGLRAALGDVQREALEHTARQAAVEVSVEAKVGANVEASVEASAAPAASAAPKRQRDGSRMPRST